MTKKTIAIIMAMQQEAEPVIKALNLKEYKAPEWSVFSNNMAIKIYKSSVYLVLNGMCKKNNVDRVGTQAAAISAFMCAELIKPDLIISLGTAGAASTHGFNIGDVVIGKEIFLYHDRRIPLPKFDQYGLGLFPVYKKSAEIAKRLKLKQAKIATGNSLINTSEDLQVLKDHEACVKEMEVASIAEVALNYNIPVLAVKGITDFYDCPEQSAEQFAHNFNLVNNNLSEAIGKVIETYNLIEEAI